MYRLQQEVAARASAVPESVNSGTTDSGAEIAILKAKLAKTEAERDALRVQPQQMVDVPLVERSMFVRAPRPLTPAGSSPPSMDALPVMPSDLQDLERWLLDRHADLRDALEFADCGSVSKLTGLLAQGAAKLHAMAEAGDEDLLLRSAPGESRFCTILKDSCFRVVLLYGLRGIRVGEASNPGPPRQLRPGHVALSESPLPVRRSARLQALGSTGLSMRLQLLCQVHQKREACQLFAVQIFKVPPMDSDDEPMVSDGRSTLWLHADSTVINSAQPTPSILARNPGLPRHIRSDLAATQVDVSCDDELRWLPVQELCAQQEWFLKELSQPIGSLWAQSRTQILPPRRSAWRVDVLPDWCWCHKTCL